MARGKGVPSTGRALDGHRTSGAVLAVLLALLALPLAAANPAPGPLAGPTVTRVEVAPSPVLPGPVAVFASAASAGPPILAIELYIDDPFSGLPRPMAPMDGAFDGPAEDASWAGTYDDFGAGWHTVYVRATTDGATWGAFATATFRVEDPWSYGPPATSADLSPPDVPRGAALTIRAFISDPFAGPPYNSAVAAAEFFVDRYGPEGTGTPMAGSFGGRLAVASWTGVPVLPAGEHTVYVHGRNTYGVWGAPAILSLTSLTPSFVLQVTADRDTARRGETVTYTLAFENRGNANATAMTIDLALPPAIAYAADTVAAAGGTRTAGTSFAFADVAPGAYAFTVSATVGDGAVDGTALLAAATLDFTNDQGWDYEPLGATAASTVIAPELRIGLEAPARALAGEPVTLTVRLDNVGSRTIPLVDVALVPSPLTTLVADDAAAIGGTPTGATAWRFANLAPGSHAFQVTERVTASAADGARLDRSVQASYAARLGGMVLLDAAVRLDVGRPVLGVRVQADRAEVPLGGEVALTVLVENLGSEPAKAAWLNVTLPSGFALAGGDSPTLSAGTRHTWAFADVAPGTRRLSVRVAASALATVSLGFDVAYTSPNGAFLGRASAPATLAVLAPPPPVGEAYATFGALAVAAAAGGFLATERGKSALFLFAVPLYTRLRKEKVLDHETRGMIRGYILANPGDHYNAIKETLELPNGTLAYHLSVLEKQMIVRSVKDGKFRRYYPAEMRVPEGGEPTKIQRVVLDLIDENPGVTPRDIAGLLGITSSTVSYHLEKLEELDLIRSQREGISKHLYVADDGDN